VRGTVRFDEGGTHDGSTVDVLQALRGLAFTCWVEKLIDSSDHGTLTYLQSSEFHLRATRAARTLTFASLPTTSSGNATASSVQP
jgi:hypothetical protein